MAHQDDDLLFQSPDLLNLVTAGKSVRTVYVTAGDAGIDMAYWSAREAGVRAAYAKMAGVADAWSSADAKVPGHTATMFTLLGAQVISLVFMRLPDGNIDGTGFPSTNLDSLEKLYQGKISSLHTVDGTPAYTKAELIDTLLFFMTSYRPDSVVTLDDVGAYGDGDHSDHHTVAYLTQQAQQRYTAPHGFRGYQGYGILKRPANVAAADATTKAQVFSVYEHFDTNICPIVIYCYNESYDPYFDRQYPVGPFPTK